MPAQIIDGNATAAQIRSELAAQVSDFKEKYGTPPSLTVVLVGSDPASQVYVRNKHKDCLEVGMRSDVIELPADTSQEELLRVVERLNNDPEVHGMIVQLPLPAHIDEGLILNLIDPDKDVDGFHPVNVGRLVVGEDCLQPCTPSGCMELLKRYNIDITGKHAVVVGRSNIVGKPVSLMLLKQNATVTICHSRTKDLPSIVSQGDIVIAAVGRAKMITADMIKDGAVVIDVGINRTDEGLVGDVDFPGVSEKASAITPVPGGVGPMTRAMLLMNTMQAAHAASARQLQATR